MKFVSEEFLSCRKSSWWRNFCLQECLFGRFDQKGFKQKIGDKESWRERFKYFLYSFTKR